MKEDLKKHIMPDQELLDIEEDIKELRMRVREQDMVGDLLLEEESERHSKKKLKELKKILNAIQKELEKAEHLLREVIIDREKEDRNIEDAILLSDGVMKVHEAEEEKQDEEECGTNREGSDHPAV